MEEEKKRQSTIQPEQVQGFNSLAEDELSLIDLMKFLARKKKFILTLTSVFTLCSIFYVQSITPIYRATVGLLDHKESFSPFSILEQIGLERVDTENIRPFIIFDKFLFNIKSYELQHEVFVNGGFQEKVFRETGIDTDQSVSERYTSIKIIKDAKDSKINYLELEGFEPKVMLEFLTALVKAAKENVNTEINDKLLSGVKVKINNLSTQIEKQTQTIDVKKQIEIVRLSKALEMAKRMGIKNNNFDKPDNGSAPVWFRYGELALQQKIMNLRSKKEEKQLLSTTNKLKLELKRLQTADLPLIKFKVAAIGEYSYSLIKPKQPWVIVGFGVALGLFISIFVGFLIDLKNS